MTATPLALQLSRIVAASPARIFNAWTIADQLKRWTCPDPNARVEADIDLRAGRHYSIRMDAEGGPFTAHGTYRVVDPPRRLVYTWGWKEAAHPMKEETLVTVELVPATDGTEIRLTHEGFPTRSDVDGHERGWKICLERLAELVTTS